MPTVAFVDGVKIQFYAREHPPPHFHAVFAEHRAQIGIATLRLINGSLPHAKLAAVVSWAEPRRAALQHTWAVVQAKQKPERIND
jgi:hypothetical protein